MKPEDYVEQVIEIAMVAGKEIRDIYLKGTFEKETKSDNTPVTSADIAAHNIITVALQVLTPNIPVLSEEDANIPFAIRQHWERYWLVDPLDGTGEFIAGSGDFSVIIALVEHNRPIMGVVYVPMTEVCYYAIAGLGAYKRDHQSECRIMSRQLPQSKDPALTLAVSRRQDPKSVLKLFSHAKHCDLIVLGGAALKSCLIAEGKADCYVRIGPTGEWDTGAAQIIVEEAGGEIMDINLQPLTYNERESLGNPNFIVVGSPQLEWDQILINE
ncbi:3'(2'),5'-bisphosphate nucleotidase CysQ [Shewanella sp. D64]|uniref:3'(2'),5'-bisphosphate nucleotidase CysQ n=1 Tax=unclassified Shewanella TaxID=196818 RepID=UPI0022BA3CB9|nr:MULTISPECIES: 3'(2'),5'-bisphosphate nucleotidase CysQ [unclassified Shewanella]MEC4726185.1 3'(2'),5'-bisphosphate nucleotidase CysQ [Shewanella sp. D64]MEC4738197.1 3'(2'),5'-bisphosphate nucleotidase CysQ [Shewanella sp. E94]WBJ95341.1 3'(2'),5'-bisphosphate nucleotidase CysQ [Shewanella sp. MTB7]